ncbi:MAG: hypothetical protein O7F71_19820, partial [Gammaproteobacteria bacterium]|nr:hypothetical protein [Gammaproteobacteria bacterium]
PKTPKRISVEKLVERADDLLLHDELTMDQQHQLTAVKHYLDLEDRPNSNVGQSALKCAEMLIDVVKLDIYQRRYGVQHS